MKKLPIGIQTFSEIRTENYIYIDKTKLAYALIENGKYYFLSRPRRFGKSLFIDTLKNIFESKKELFKGLYIYDKLDWAKSFPVININFAGGVIRDEKLLNEKITNKLFEIAGNYEITLKYKNISDQFEELIKKIHNKFNRKVVILIDEYDKPILDNITDPSMASDMRDGLKNLYSVIKGTDEYIKFVFLTGVSKFSKVSIFSGLNNLEDITLNEDYATICGYTQNDLETSFASHLENVDMDKLREWYNGYNFLGDNVYNPFDILLFIKNRFKYNSYWFSTGTPSFLIYLIKQNR